MTGSGRSLHNIHYQTRPRALNPRFQAPFPLLLALATLVASCTSERPAAPPTEASGTTGPSGPTGPGPGADATGPTGPSGPGDPTPPPPPVPPPPAPLPVTSIDARLGAASTPLSAAPEGTPEPVVDPAATFEVRLAVASRGTRLVLLDSRDAMVPSTGDLESGGGTSRFTLVPHETLAPGGRYFLRIEGVDDRMVKTDDGRSFEPVVVSFRVSGEPPPAPPKKVKKKRAR